MFWVVNIIGLVLVGLAGAFLLGPTLRTLFGPDFEPSPKDEASVRNATMPRMVDGGQ